jgi:hypothetical protein
VAKKPSASPVAHPVSGFWQYENATVSWTHFYAWLRRIIQTDGSWTIFELDETMPGRRGPKKTESDLGRELVKPGRYIILKEGGCHYLLMLSFIVHSPLFEMEVLYR